MGRAGVGVGVRCPPAARSSSSAARCFSLLLCRGRPAAAAPQGRPSSSTARLLPDAQLQPCRPQPGAACASPPRSPKALLFQRSWLAPCCVPPLAGTASCVIGGAPDWWRFWRAMGSSHQCWNQLEPVQGSSRPLPSQGTTGCAQYSPLLGGSWGQQGRVKCSLGDPGHLVRGCFL